MNPIIEQRLNSLGGVIQLLDAYPNLEHHSRVDHAGVVWIDQDHINFNTAPSRFKIFVDRLYRDTDLLLIDQDGNTNSENQQYLRNQFGIQFDKTTDIPVGSAFSILKARNFNFLYG